MRRCGMPTTIPERLLSALDACLDAMLAGPPGDAREQRTDSQPDGELEPLLSVASQLMRSREWIDERLVSWRDSRPLIERSAAPDDPFVTAGRWPGLT